MDVPGLAALLREYPDVPLISISDAQRAPVPWANWAATIPHGLPMEAITPRLERGGYLAFLGRISPEKRLDRAIEIATRVGYPLRIAAKVDPVDAAYFADEIEPLLAAEGVDYIGEIGDDEKGDFLGGAAALVFPIDWPEPFGLVMVEAMARATPVLAFRRGSVAEVVEDGVTGVIVDTVDEAVAAAPRLLALPRSGVRAAAERRFGVEVMACAHVKLYEQLAPAIGRAAPVEGHAAATSVADLAPVQPIPQITQMPLDDRTPTSRPDESPGRG
jgi:glycosyltransferase involved in cell wall biosynthesis